MPAPNPTSLTRAVNCSLSPLTGLPVSEEVLGGPYSLCMSKIRVEALLAWINPARIILARKDLPEPVVPKIPDERWTNFSRFRQTACPCSRVSPTRKMVLPSSVPKIWAISSAFASLTGAWWSGTVFTVMGISFAGRFCSQMAYSGLAGSGPRSSIRAGMTARLV